MQDAVCLANWINVLPSLDTPAVEKIFDEYYQERYPVAIQNFNKSRAYASSNAKVSFDILHSLFLSLSSIH
jgi:hypothetical protein